MTRAESSKFAIRHIEEGLVCAVIDGEVATADWEHALDYLEWLGKAHGRVRLVVETESAQTIRQLEEVALDLCERAEIEVAIVSSSLSVQGATMALSWSRTLTVKCDSTIAKALEFLDAEVHLSRVTRTFEQLRQATTNRLRDAA